FLLDPPILDALPPGATADRRRRRRPRGRGRWGSPARRGLFGLDGAQDLGDGFVELGRDLAALGELGERARQRDVAEDGNAGLAGDLLDALRDEALALRDDDGRTVGVPVVAQGDG